MNSYYALKTTKESKYYYFIGDCILLWRVVGGTHKA